MIDAGHALRERRVAGIDFDGGVRTPKGSQTEPEGGVCELD